MALTYASAALRGIFLWEPCYILFEQSAIGATTGPLTSTHNSFHGTKGGSPILWPYHTTRQWSFSKFLSVIKEKGGLALCKIFLLSSAGPLAEGFTETLVQGEGKQNPSNPHPHPPFDLN